MENAGDFLEIVGLMAVLVSGAIVFITLLQWVAGKRRNRVTLGVQVAGFFALAYAFHAPVVEFIGLGDVAKDVADQLATLFWLSFAFTVNTAVDKMVWRGVLTRAGEPMMPKLLTDGVAVFVYLAAIMIVMHFVYDEPITALVATSGAVAFVIGYSAQSTLGELFSGVSLQASRSIKKGDGVQIGDVFGVVHDIDWRSVSIREFLTNSLVVFPNSVLATKEFTNYSAPNNLIQMHADFTVEFTAPPDLVGRAVRESFADARIALKDPKPTVHPLCQGQFGVEYRVKWYIENISDWFPSQEEAQSIIWSALRKHKIKPGMNHQFSGPGSQFNDEAWHVRTADPASERDFIRTMSQFMEITDQEFDDLITHCERRAYVPPEVMSEMGAKGDTLFILVSGKAAADMRYEEGDDELFLANELVPGELFGVRALLMDGTRTEQVQCLEHAVVYAVPGHTMRNLLMRYPEMRDAMMDEIGARNQEAERRRKAHEVELSRRARLARKREIAQDLPSRISGLFKGGLFNRGPAKDKIADAAMAAAALVAAADGVIEPAERDAVIQTFKDLDLFRYIDADKGLAKFDTYSAALTSGDAASTRQAMDAVTQIKGTEVIVELVLDVAIAISAADGEVEGPEEERIQELEKALGVSET